MSRFFRSIRWRLQAWHGLILLLVAVGFCAPAYRLAVVNQTQRIDSELARTERTLFRALMDAVRTPAENASPAGSKPIPFAEFVQRLRETPVVLPPNVKAIFQGDDPGYTYFSFRDDAGRVLLQSDNVPADLEFLPVPKDELKEDTRSVSGRRELRRSSTHGWRLVVGRDTTPDQESMRRLAFSVLATVLGVWALGLLGGWWLAGRAIRPIRNISDTATRIADGNLEERIPITDMDSELGELSGVLNQTFERLHASFERQKQFTADASHELRTPVTILLSESQRILKRERTAEEYKEAIQTCGDTARRMAKLIESMLILARQDSEQIAASREPCDLAAIIQECARTLSPLAAEKQVSLEVASSPAPCHGDASALAVLASNLVANAIQHHAGHGHVWLESGLRDGRAHLSVRDDGPGIPEADLPHLFERFYRVDKARTRSAGHSGLGLSIAKAIADNHGATLSVTSTHGQGATFELCMPEAAAAAPLASRTL